MNLILTWCSQKIVIVRNFMKEFGTKKSSQDAGNLCGKEFFLNDNNMFEIVAKSFKSWNNKIKKNRKELFTPEGIIW